MPRVPVVVVGTSPWRAPWLTEQNLAHSLAKSHPVLYVDPPDIRPRRVDEHGDRRLRAVTAGGRSLHVFRPWVLPLRSRAITARLSSPAYGAQLRWAARRLGLREPVLITGDARPGAVGSVGERLSVYLVKDWIYDDAELLGRPAAELRAERDAICARADRVVAISPSLRASLGELGIAASVVRHGFHADLASRYDAPAPPEYGRLPGPRLVFGGRIDGRLDVGKLRAVARATPGGSVVLIGPVSPRMPAAELAVLESEPNVHLLGPRDRLALPAYLAHADALLIPYRRSVWSDHGSPLKLWDYLYAGPPIVGSGYTILREYEPLLRYHDDDDEFATAVARAAAADDGRVARRDYALTNTWDHRAGELGRLLGLTATPDAGSAR